MRGFACYTLIWFCQVLITDACRSYCCPSSSSSCSWSLSFFPFSDLRKRFLRATYTATMHYHPVLISVQYPLAPSLRRSLAPSPPRSLRRSLPRSLPPSLPPSFPPSPSVKKARAPPPHNKKNLSPLVVPEHRTGRTTDCRHAASHRQSCRGIGQRKRGQGRLG